MRRLLKVALLAPVLAACGPGASSEGDVGEIHIDAASPDAGYTDAAVEDASVSDASIGDASVEPRPCPMRVDRLTLLALNQQRVIEPASGPVLSASSDNPAAVEVHVVAGQVLVRALASGSAQVTLQGPSSQLLVLVDVNLENSPYATTVVDVQYGDGAGFGQSGMPGIVLGPPHGAGAWAGSPDVVSLGVGGHITIELGLDIADGPGPDLILFENPFVNKSTGTISFIEPGQVSVSEDGISFTAFPCGAAPSYQGCAGLSPVLANPGNSIDPTDPPEAGGDAFDLSAIGLSRARFVRVTDISGGPAVGTASGFDLDAVASVNALPRDAKQLLADATLALTVGGLAEPRFDVVSSTSTTYGVRVQCVSADPGIVRVDCGCTLTGLAEGTTSVRGWLGDLEATIVVPVSPSP